MRILIIGRGGREHALALRLAEDPGVSEVLLAPGNEGASRRFRCLSIAEDQAPALAEACRQEAVDLVVVGPEAPLARGLVDDLAAHGVLAFGPTAAAARLESSKWFAKQVMLEAGVPTARAERHERAPDALAALTRFAPPWVIKRDGLAAGKGVCVTPDRAGAEEFIRAAFEPDAGADPTAVVIEEFLDGEEASVMAVCDGERHVLLTPARDSKRAFDADRGPNTGGMGACAPVATVGEAFERETSERIVTPVLRVMAARGTPFRGVLYVGLMIGARGLNVVEFNVRFGDPEAQVILPLTGGPLGTLFVSAARGTLEARDLRRERGAAVAVALVDHGYPENVRGGGRIEGLERVGSTDAHVVYAAATWEDGAWTIRGGRAAYVVATARDGVTARSSAYAAIATLRGGGWRCRGDIGGGDPAAATALFGPPASRGRED